MRINRLLKRDEMPGFAPSSREPVRSREAVEAQIAREGQAGEPGQAEPEVKKPTPISAAAEDRFAAFAELCSKPIRRRWLDFDGGSLSSGPLAAPSLMSRKQQSVTAGRALICMLCWFAACAVAGADDETVPPANSSIRRLESKHLVLDTDLPAGEEIDALPGYFDQAFSQWCGYLASTRRNMPIGAPHGRLMKSPERFQAAGMLPADVPQFNTGCTPRQRFLAAGPGQRLLPPASAVARRDARLHVRAGRRCCSALVLRGNRRAAGHASACRRQLDAQLLSALKRRSAEVEPH